MCAETDTESAILPALQEIYAQETKLIFQFDRQRELEDVALFVKLYRTLVAVDDNGVAVALVSVCAHSLFYCDRTRS